MLEIGQKAPDFTLENQDGKQVSLADFRGQKVVLYFYSKDMTGGCTKQACGFARLMPDFTAENAVIIGISRDLPATHRRFADKYELPFLLLSDPEHAVHELYGVWQEKTLYGKKTMGTVRSTFLIDETGIISGIYRKVKAADNPDDMLTALRA